MIASNELQTHLLASLLRVVQGLALGLALGLLSATISGLTRWGENLVDSNMEVLRAVPNFALLPVLIVWFGIGEQPKVDPDRPRRLRCRSTSTPTAPSAMSTPRSSRRRGRSASAAGELIRASFCPVPCPGFLVGLRLALTGAGWR